MEIRTSKSENENDGQERRDSLKTMNEDANLTHMGTLSSLKVANHKNVLVVNAKRPSNTGYCTREPFLQHMQSVDHRVPKHIITLDEKFLSRCLELVYASAMGGHSCSSVLESLPLQMSALSEATRSLNFKSELSEFVDYFPRETDSIGNICTISRSKAQQSVSTKKGIVLGRTYITDATKSADDSDSTSSQLSISSLRKPERKMSVFESERFQIETKHKRHISASSSYTLSGRSPVWLFDNLNRGMLHCTWKSGLPHYIFSLDNHNEIYIVNIIKSETPKDDGFDYIYTFHTNEAYLVGKMRVSTLLKHCPNNLEIKDTEFVLFGEDDRDTGEVQTSTSHNSRKCKAVSKRMSQIFKTSPISGERPSSRHALTKAKPFIDLSANFVPNLELAAIIVKDHVCVIPDEPEVGGWGMKFLKKIESKSRGACVDTPPSPCDCFWNDGDRSPSMNIVIAADFHGGPRNRIGGPSSLVERWRSGGKCDCGGWDIGCPITVLNTERSNEENLSQTDIRVAGLQDSDPVMKMVNIRDGLYVIHFQSNLSALQTLSIAVSMIHTQSVQ